jgi:signal transduction histidine kinase
MARGRNGGRSFEVIAKPIETAPKTSGWVLVVREVTQEREIQQRAQQQERLAAVGQLAAGIAHDFNNIMAVIVLYAKMSLRMQDLPPKVRERLETISRQARRATDLIQQILDFSRRAVLERRPMDLLPFLKEQVSLLERTLPESIKVELTYGSDEYTVEADPTRMQQMVMDLAVNARDAMPAGGKLHIDLRQADTGRGPKGSTAARGVAGRLGAGDGKGHRGRHPIRRAAARVRSFLHHQVTWGGHRLGAGSGVGHCKATPWPH